MKRPSVQTGLRLGLVSMLLAGAGLASCSTGQRAVGLDDFPAYPSEKAQIEILDVQVLRDGDTISLTNTTAERFDQSRIWLNREFSYAVDGIEVGETIRLDLNEFRNRYGARFRAGGFFATQRPKNVVLAQIEPERESQRLLGLIVVDGRAGR